MKIINLPRKIFKKTLKITKQAYYTIFGSAVECNICGYKATKFASDSWHLYCGCPNCNTGLRHRLLWAALNLDEFKSLISKSVLHFAPDTALRKHIEKKATNYKTADFNTEDYFYESIDYTIDMSDMPGIANETFDCVIACDVLEHVKDDRKALRELHRILKKGGFCIFTIPQLDHLVETIEDLSNLTPTERENKFGIVDHWRIYGSDFEVLLSQTGFQVSIVDETNFSAALVKKHVLFPPVLSERQFATNYRKVYFGKKK